MKKKTEITVHVQSKLPVPHNKLRRKPTIGFNLKNYTGPFVYEALELFLYWIRERHTIHLLRTSGAEPPWTKDGILQNVFFTNPYREHDKTTVWFQENIRQPLANDPCVLFATVAFRWFNFIPTASVLMDPETDPNMFLHWDSKLVRSILHCLADSGKVFTGAYMIKSPNGQNKVDGICDCIDILARCLNWLRGSAILPKEIRKALPRGRNGQGQHLPQDVPWADEDQDETRCSFLADLFTAGPIGKMSLQEACAGFQLFPFLGSFMAYEIVTDLRHTYLLSGAPDIMTWANLGPGAIRGLLRLTGEFVPGPADGSYRAPHNASELMLALLAITQSHFAKDNRFPKFELRDIEHSLCEVDKYIRVLNGEGQAKRQFDGT